MVERLSSGPVLCDQCNASFELQVDYDDQAGTMVGIDGVKVNTEQAEAEPGVPVPAANTTADLVRYAVTGTCACGNAVEGGIRIKAWK